MSPGDPPVPTWSIAELHEAINGLLIHVFGDEVWIEGEIRNLSRSPKAHVFFDLVDPGSDGDPQRPMLSVTLFDKDRQAVNRHLTEQGGAVRMGDGVRVRIRGRLSVYGARSTVQLVMSWIDPAYTLGVLGAERDQVLSRLAAEGLLDRNAARPMPFVPLHVALVTSIGSAAHADALDELRRAGVGLRVTVVDTRTQGADAERAIVAALRVAFERRVDLVLLVRGGGARTDLAAFDTDAVARTIAAAPVPVITGIGHEIDRTVADDVAHSAHKTPTAAAAAVGAAAAAVAHSLEVAAAQIPAATRGRVLRAQHSLDDRGRRAGRAAAHHLIATSRDIEHLARRSAAAPQRSLTTTSVTVEGIARRLEISARRSLTRVDDRLTGLAARTRAHDPALALARGWSVTRGPDGRVVRSVDRLARGDELRTTLASGEIRSSVTSTDPQEPS